MAGSCWWIFTELGKLSFWEAQVGQNAVYIAIDDASLQTLWSLEGKQFRDRFLQLEEGGEFDRLDIGKIWDVLHCTLTGVSARAPIDGDPLSEAIVGVRPKLYDDDDYAVFVSAIDHTEIERVLDALRQYDKAKLAASIRVATLRDQRVYPTRIWMDGEAVLVSEMDTSVRAICQFLQESHGAGKHVLVTIL